MWDAWDEIEQRYESDPDGFVRDAADALGVGLGAAGVLGGFARLPENDRFIA